LAERNLPYQVSPGAAFSFTNGFLTVNFSASTQRISKITNERDGVAVTVDQNLLSYTSIASGAYAFGPDGNAVPVSSSPPTTTVVNGPLVYEAHQEFQDPNSGNSWAKQDIRLYQPTNGADVLTGGFLELDFEVGVLPSAVEVVTSFSTSIKSRGGITTDDNGFEFLNRQPAPNTPIPGLYYPTVYASYISDATAQLSIISERSHGVSSQANGEIELMLHRNPDMGDGWGPALTDTSIVFPTIRVLLDTPQGSPKLIHKQSYLLNFPLTPFYAPSVSSLNSWNSAYLSNAQLLATDLPPNVHFLSLYSLDSTSTKFIFRLTHLYATGEDPVNSVPATVDVAQLFSKFKIVSFVETTLTGNKVLQSPARTVVVLSPKEIRTFIVELQ